MTFFSTFSLAQDFLVLGDLLLQLVELRLNLVALEGGEALQLHFQNGLRLAIGKFKRGDQTGAGFGGSFGGANQLDDGVEIAKAP